MKKWIVEDAPLFKAWLILLVVTIILNNIPGEPKGNFTIFQYFLTAVSLLFTLVCIRYIRGKKVKSKKPPFLDLDISSWGYIWRSLISMIIVFISLVGGEYLITGSTTNSNVTLNQVLTLILTPVVIWGLFCKERIARVRKLVMYLQGM